MSTDHFEKILIGIVSSDGKNINEHFGRAKEYFIYEIDNELIKFIEKRESPEQAGIWELVYEVLKDCKYIFAGAAGVHPVNFFALKGIKVAAGEGDIDKALKGFIKRRRIIEKMNFGIGKENINLPESGGCSGGGCNSGCSEEEINCGDSGKCR